MGTLDYRRAYRRNLPHFQPPGATFFVTFRLAGSLPQEVVDQWNKERQWLEHLKQSNPLHHERVKSDFERVWFVKFETLLDGATSGPICLREEQIAMEVAESLHYRDGKVYRLDAFSIMPNHVHAVFKPLPVAPLPVALLPVAPPLVTQAVSLRSQDECQDTLPQADSSRYHSLASIMQSLKGYTSFMANRQLGRQGEFWAHESYDHYVRNTEELQRIMRYVLNNPVKSGYVDHWSGWKWNYRRE